jgi:hypothetical protein
MQVIDIVTSCDIWLMKPTKHATHKIATRFNNKPHDNYKIYKLWINFELYSTKAHNSKRAPHKAQRQANKVRMKSKQKTQGYKQKTKNKGWWKNLCFHEVLSGLHYIGM